MEERRTKKSPSLKSQLKDDVGAVVASSAGIWGRNFLDRRERRGRAGEGCRREGKRELGEERERDRERSERRGRGRGKERAGTARAAEKERKGGRGSILGKKGRTKLFG